MKSRLESIQDLDFRFGNKTVDCDAYMTLEQMSNLSRVAVAERTKQFFYLHHTNKTNKFGCLIDGMMVDGAKF